MDALGARRCQRQGASGCKAQLGMGALGCPVYPVSSAAVIDKQTGIAAIEKQQVLSTCFLFAVVLTLTYMCNQLYSWWVSRVWLVYINQSGWCTTVQPMYSTAKLQPVRKLKTDASLFAAVVAVIFYACAVCVHMFVVQLAADCSRLQ